MKTKPRLTRPDWSKLDRVSWSSPSGGITDYQPSFARLYQGAMSPWVANGRVLATSGPALLKFKGNMKKTIKKKNPADATNRNVRAANRKITLLKSRVKILEGRVDKHYLILNELRDMFDAKPK